MRKTKSGGRNGGRPRKDPAERAAPKPRTRRPARPKKKKPGKGEWLKAVLAAGPQVEI